MTDDGYEVLIKSSTKFTGPGHGCVFDTPDGATWIIYNAFDLSDVSKGRTLMLDRVNWMEDWPSVRGSIGSFSADAPALN
jgi:arabinan endo-1,5-alpha-L-arabinosidase